MKKNWWNLLAQSRRVGQHDEHSRYLMTPGRHPQDNSAPHKTVWSDHWHYKECIHIQLLVNLMIILLELIKIWWLEKLIIEETLTGCSCHSKFVANRKFLVIVDSGVRLLHPSDLQPYKTYIYSHQKQVQLFQRAAHTTVFENSVFMSQLKIYFPYPKLCVLHYPRKQWFINTKLDKLCAYKKYN